MGPSPVQAGARTRDPVFGLLRLPSSGDQGTPLSMLGDTLVDRIHIEISPALVMLTLIAYLVAAPDRAEAWREMVDSDANPGVLLGRGVNTAGLLSVGSDVVTAGLEATPDPQIRVARHLGFNGSPIWEYSLLPIAAERSGAALARSPDGAILAASFQEGTLTSAVAKLAPETGLPIWHATFTESIALRALASGADGAAVAAGAIFNPETSGRALTVLKLSPDTGQELWRYVGSETDQAEVGAWAVEVDATGDVFAAGSVFENALLGYPDFVVLKLSGADGSLLWKHTVPSVSAHGGLARDLAVLPNGDVVAVGQAVVDSNRWFDIVAARLEGGTGQEVWRTVIYAADCGCGDSAFSVAIDAAADVLVAGSPSTGLFSVMKLAGSSGALLWRSDVPNLGEAYGGESAGADLVQSTPDGNLIAAGRL